MPVNVIDVIKPKNNGSFPIVEAVDVSVSESLRLPEALEAKADASAIAEINAAVEAKANTSDVESATANLQGQINQIEISATAEAVVAPEVAAARVSENGTEYATLKERLDTEFTPVNSFVDKFTELEAEWTEGGYIVPTTGAIAPYSSTANLRYYYSNRMRVDAVNSITFQQYYRAAGGAAFYNADGVFISGSDNTAGAYGDSKTLQVPVGACFFALTASTNTVTREDEFPDIVIDVTVNSLRKEIPALVEQVSEIEESYPDVKAFSDKFTELSAEWNEGGYIVPTDGTIASFASTTNLRYYYSDKIRCDAVKSITFNQYYRAAGGAAFYDATGAYISGAGNTEGSYGDSVTLQVPSNAYFFALTASTNTVTHEDQFPDLESDVTPESLRKGIPAIAEQVSLIMEDYPQIKSFADGFTAYDPTWNPNGYINHANGNVGSWTPTATLKYYYSDRLRCDNVKQITMEQYFTGSAGAAFYDASGTFISGVSNSGSFGDVVTLDVPDHACFFATTARSDSVTGEDLFPDMKIKVTLESIGKGILTQDEEAAIQTFATNLVSTNPLDHIPNDGGYFETFRKIAVIGDSLASGEVYYKNPDQTYSGADLYEYSWGSYIARKCGSEVVHFARGGMTTRSWLATYVGQDFEDSKAQAYIIGLQVNDRYPHVNPETGQTEATVPLGSPSDIDVTDRSNNADTYYGNLASIIQYIQEVVEKAKIFVITDPRNDGDYNTAVRYMATIFNNVYIIDLYEYGADLYTTPALGDLWVHGHLTSIGYKYAADHILTLMDYIIHNNMSEFLEVPFIVSE